MFKSKFSRLDLADAGSSYVTLVGAVALLSGWLVLGVKAVALAAGVAA